MEFSIPLKDASCPRVPLSVGCDGRCELPPSDDCRVIHNGAGWMCVFDSVRAVLCEVSCDDCVLLGSFFFRARGDSHIFSCVCAGQVYDFSDGDTSADAKLSEDYGVLFSSDDFIDNVSFSSKGLVICTRGGYFGYASLSAHLVGFFHQPVKGASQYRWCAHGDLCACITPQCIFIHALLGGGALQSYRVEKDFSGIGPISSVALVVDTFKGVICLLVNFINSREVLILRITETHEVDSGTNALLVSYAVDRSVFSDSRPTTCVKELEGSHIVATVFPDCVSCAWFAGSDIHQSTIVHNDLPLPFACANWCQPAANGNRLAVLRSDAVCLVYHVNASVDRRIVGDIFLAASISMPLPHGCIMPTGRGLCEHLWVLSGCDFFDVGERNSSIFRQHDDGSFHRVNLHGGVESMGTTFLLDIVPTKEASWFVHMSSDGVCSLTSYGQQGRLCLVKDLDAQQVTSCIAFDLSGKVYCALGFVNGDVQIFADSELRSHVRMAHRGCVDRLIHRHFGGSAGAVMLISAATHLGSICLHKFDTADILCTLQSPATPLTGCFVDAIGEYIFTYSGATGNVWHIPTGRLERAFICYSGVNVSTENLLTESWLSALRIDHQKCFGGRYFAIKVNVMRLIEDLRSRSSVPSDYPAAVNLLYRACDTPMQHLIFEQGPWSRLIDDLNLDVSLCGNVAVLLQAIFMTCALLDVTRNGSLALKAARSSIRLHSVVVQRVETETIALDEVLEEYFLLLFEYGEAFSAAIHAGLAFFVENVRFSLLTEALVLFLSSVSVSSSENRSPASDDSLNLAMTYVLMGFASARQCREWPSSMLQVVLENAASDLKHLTSLLLAGDVSFGRDTKGQRQLIAVCLGYPLLHTIEEYDTFVHNLVRACFGTDDGFAQSSCADALQLIASHNMENFLRAIFLRYFENGSWRASMITFLARCVAQYPWQAYTSVSVIAEILLRAMNSQSHEKTFKLACAAAGTHLLQACVNVLPNVSFHQHQQHLAVGMNDGSVSVFDVRAGTLVNRFRAHSHPVLMVAFSSSSSTESSKLATVSERMSSVSLWASTRSSSILNLFSSSASEFRKDKSMSIPEITVREEDLPNVAHCCVLKWLSSQCVELSTPWHNTLEFALA